MRFTNREHAASLLAEKLKPLSLTDPLILAIPRGGIVQGAVLARELNAELDVVISRKLRAPDQPELAIGAVSEDGQIYLDEYASALNISESYLEDQARFQMKEIESRKALFRGGNPPAKISGRSVIITDDGIATGSTMIASVKIIRDQNPKELIIAVPVIPRDRVENFRKLADQFICLHAPAEFYAVGQFYEDFSQVEDETVVQLLSQFRSQKTTALG